MRKIFLLTLVGLCLLFAKENTAVNVIIDCKSDDVNPHYGTGIKWSSDFITDKNVIKTIVPIEVIQVAKLKYCK